MSLIKVSAASLDEQEKIAISRVIDNGYLGMGQEVMLFEKELEDFFEHKTRVVCVNTGTSALHLAAQACGLGEGDEVLVPSITYVASFQAIAATGATPIACDIDLKNGCLSLDSIKNKINNRTKAIMHVHYAGSVGDREAILSFARQHKLRLIEDAAHSFGGYNQGQKIGIDGDISCFSFDSIKNITCGEGGAIVTTDEKVINIIKDLRLLAVEKDSDQRYAGKRSWDFNVQHQGWRYHMSNINAAIGRTQLTKIGVFAEKRRNLANLYQKLLTNVKVKMLDLDFTNSVPHIFPILVGNDKRNLLMQWLMDHQIESGIHYKPNHLLTKFLQGDCHNADQFGKETLTLPLHCKLNEADIIFICQKIKDFFKE